MKEDFIDKYLQIYQEFLTQYDLFNYDYNKSKLEKLRQFFKLPKGSSDEVIINKAVKKGVPGFKKIQRYYKEYNWKPLEEIFQDYYNKHFHIIWGYYSVLDSDSKTLLYFLSKDFSDDNKEIFVDSSFWKFTYIPIPARIQNSKLNSVIKSIANDDKRFFNRSIFETPTIYRSNSWSLEENEIQKLYSNTYLQKLNKTSSFNVVFGDEVLFFLYGYLYFSGRYKKLNDIWNKLFLNRNFEFGSHRTPKIKQLTKFALSVESKLININRQLSLHHFLNLYKYKEDWGTNNEFNLRKKVDNIINNLLLESKIKNKSRKDIKEKDDQSEGEIENFLAEFHTCIIIIFEALIEKADKFFSSQHSDIQLQNKVLKNRPDYKLEIWKILSRFNLEASLNLLKETEDNMLHDIFMFPMVKSWKESYKTKNLAYKQCLKNGLEEEVEIPLIMTTYINTLYGINGELDEDENSLSGFNITMEVCKALAKPLVESQFYGRLIRSKLLPQAIRAAISQVIARTTSHNTGSHVLANNLETECPKDLSAFKVYLRQRMLFNADIASNSSKFFSPILFTELTESFRRLRIVTKYISGIEGRSFSYFILEDNIVNTDLIVSLANDTLGFQAMYILFENLIRNYFKHGKGSGKLFDKENNGLKLSLLKVEYDNPYYYCFEISDGTVINDITIFARIKELIDNPILNSSNRLRPQGLGYLEIKAALCYLNDVPLDHIDNPVIKNDNTKKVFEVLPISDKHNILRYQFLLPKPFFIKLSNSNSLDKSSLEKGIVDSKFPTEFDSQCLYFYGDPTVKQLSNSSLTPRVVDSSHCPKSFSDIHFLIDEFYNHWLRDLNDYTNFSCYILDGEKTDIKYYEIVFNQTNESIERNELLSNRYSIFFDNHGSRIDYILSNKQNIGIFFYEDYGTESYTGKKISNLEFEKPYLLKQIFEASKIKIAIIDERIQRHAIQPYNKFNQECSTEETLLAEILELSNIFIPIIENTNIDLNSENFENSLKSEIKLYCEKWLKSEKLDFLIIHLGVLEKFTSDKSSESIHKIIQEIKPDNMENSHLIIISERGTPDNIREDYRFLHFSNVSKYIIEERSKMGLVNSIFNSRSLKNQTHKNDNYNNFHKA